MDKIIKTVEQSDKFNFKKLLTDSSTVKTIEKLESDLLIINEDILENSLKFIDILNEEFNIPITVLTKTNMDIITHERKKMNRYNYTFPSIINIGTIKEYAETPSKILAGKTYVTETPLFIPMETSSIGFFMNEKHKERINNTLELIGLKAMAALPVGLVKVSIIDKNGAGQNFPTLLSLHDKLKPENVLTNDKEIESKLLELKNSVSKISRSVTASGYDSIENYNKNTKEIAQVYNFLYISNFPNGFTKKSAESLISLLESGYTAGIYVYMTFAIDPKFGINSLVSNIQLSEYLKSITVFEISNKQTHYEKFGFDEPNVSLFSNPFKDENIFNSFVNTAYKIVLEKIDNKVIVQLIDILNNEIKDKNLRPIIDIMDTIPKELWTGNASKGVSAQFAKNGIENVNLSIGINAFDEDENAHHGFIMGTTGSGKTNVLNDFILHLALKYSPKELQFWLLDYKEGTEFAIYKNFPYVQILSMESEIEFGQDVLLKAIKIIEERGILFKEQGCGNLHDYNNSVVENDKLPRIIIFIDEFQHLFYKKGNISNISNERMNNILRRGRSFGVNLFLSTQTLKDVDIDSQLLSNMPLRIGLKMDEKDSVKIFGEDNDSLDYVNDPGEGVYNNSYGKSKYNISFQAYLAEKKSIHAIIDLLKNKISETFSLKYVNNLYLNRSVYNGEMEGNYLINKELCSNLDNGIFNTNLYIGEPAGLDKEHSSLSLKTDFGENLLICGGDISKAYSLFYFMIKQLSYDKNDIFIANSYNLLASNIENLVKKDNYYDNSNTENLVDYIFNIMEERKEISIKDKSILFKKIYMFNFFIDNMKVYKIDSYSRDSHLAKIKKIINEGPQLGIHVLLYTTNYSSLVSTGLTTELDRFKKKICLKDGNSLKILGENIYGVSFSKSKYVSIFSSGEVSEAPIKFKPYNAIDIGEPIDLEDVVDNEGIVDIENIKEEI